jgi:hypothetical protein
MTKTSKWGMLIAFGLTMFLFGMGLGTRISNDNWNEAMLHTFVEMQGR